MLYIEKDTPVPLRHRSFTLDSFQEAGNILEPTQHPNRKHGDTHRTEQERNGQKNQTVLRGVCCQHRYTEDGNDSADQPEKYSRKLDHANAEQRKQVDCQRDRDGEDFEDQFHVRSLLFLCTVIIRYLLTSRKDTAGQFSFARAERISRAASHSRSWLCRRSSKSAS